jgi:cell division protein FtsN
MKTDLKFDFKTILPRLRKLQKPLAAHQTFAITLVVLLAYVFVVWQISHLAAADPSEAARAANNTTSNAPAIDKNAIKQIQALEQNSTSVHVLFENARNNPFQE